MHKTWYGQKWNFYISIVEVFLCKLFCLHSVLLLSVVLS